MNKKNVIIVVIAIIIYLLLIWLLATVLPDQILVFLASLVLSYFIVYKLFKILLTKKINDDIKFILFSLYFSFVPIIATIFVLAGIGELLQDNHIVFLGVFYVLSCIFNIFMVVKYNQEYNLKLFKVSLTYSLAIYTLFYTINIGDFPKDTFLGPFASILICLAYIERKLFLIEKNPNDK